MLLNDPGHGCAASAAWFTRPLIDLESRRESARLAVRMHEITKAGAPRGDRLAQHLFAVKRKMAAMIMG